LAQLAAGLIGWLTDRRRTCEWRKTALREVPTRTWYYWARILLTYLRNQNFPFTEITSLSQKASGQCVGAITLQACIANIQNSSSGQDTLFIEAFHGVPHVHNVSDDAIQ
jgi:hypothetical protein